MAQKRIDEFTAKTSFVNADLVLIADSADLDGGNPKYKKLTFQNLMSTLATTVGYVIGPASVADNTIARYDTTTGKLLQASLVTISDTGTVNIPSGQKYQINSVNLAVSDLGAAPLITKGDILVYASGLDRLAVGTNNQILVADSTQAEGIKWADSFEDVYLINSESDFPLSGGGTEYELVDGTYKINANVSLSKPITLAAGTTTVLIESTNANNVLSNSMGTAMIVIPDLVASFQIFNINISSPSGPVFDIDNPSGGGNMVLNSCILNNCSSLGTVEDAGFVLQFSALIDIGQGITLNDNARVSLSKVSCVNWKNQASCVYFNFTGAHADIKINANFITTAGSNESIYDFDSAMTLTSAQIYGNSHDISAGGAIFASGSKEQDALYFDFKNNTEIANSTVSAAVILTGGSTLTNIPAVDAAVIVNGSTGFTSSLTERTSVTNTGVTEYTGNRNTKLIIDSNLSLEPETATKDLYSKLYGLLSTEYTVTFTNGTNTINEVATALSNGDRISFLDTPGTLPAELREDIIYYVVNKATDSFQVSYTSGGAAVAFTDDGTPTNKYKVCQTCGSEPKNTIASGAPRDLVTQALAQVQTGCKIVLTVSNATDAVNIYARNVYIRIVS